MDFTAQDKPGIASVIPGKAPATSMSYHSDGKRLFVASEQDSRLQVIDCMSTGKAEHAALKVEREQIHVVEATHHDHCVLFAGKGSPTQPVGQRHAVNYWSTHDNKLLRKFRGHSDQVASISMCPADDTFLSSSVDRTVRLWNVQAAGCLAECKLPDETTGSPRAVFDTTGLVFAVTASMSEGQGHYIHLYDARNHSAGAFAELKVSQADLEKAIQSQINMTTEEATELSKSDWHSIAFNQSGSQIMVSGDKGMSVVLDGFEGTVQRVLVAKSQQPAASCFTPDDKTVLAGNDDGSITCWDVGSGAVVKTLTGHNGPVTCVAANPEYAQIASACKDTALWLW